MNKQAELIEEKDKKITELHAWADSMLRKIEIYEEKIEVLAARHEKALIEGAARLAERDEARAQIAELTNLKKLWMDEAEEGQDRWREARAQIAAREEEFNVALTDLGNENLDLKAQIAAKDAALADLLSWFPDKPSEPQWQLSAGVYGADDAIAAARQALATPTQEKGDHHEPE